MSDKQPVVSMQMFYTEPAFVLEDGTPLENVEAPCAVPPDAEGTNGWAPQHTHGGADPQAVTTTEPRMSVRRNGPPGPM